MTATATDTTTVFFVFFDWVYLEGLELLVFVLTALLALRISKRAEYLFSMKWRHRPHFRVWTSTLYVIIHGFPSSNYVTFTCMTFKRLIYGLQCRPFHELKGIQIELDKGFANAISYSGHCCKAPTCDIQCAPKCDQTESCVFVPILEWMKYGFVLVPLIESEVFMKRSPSEWFFLKCHCKVLCSVKVAKEVKGHRSYPTLWPKWQF